MSSKEIRRKFLEFFENRGHKIVPSSSLLPDDSSVLLTTAGMQQFKKYYIEPSLAPAKNVVSIQKCFRTSDIDEVGDESHLTFFEMLGNFSFGGYCKEDAIKYAHEFLTQELRLKIDYVTTFEGENELQPDEESEKIWWGLGIKNIRKLGRTDNFWGPTGSEGPCGPTTEIYVKGMRAEIWNLVFNEYYSKDGKLTPLKTKGVDTGMGFERLLTVVQKVSNIFETDLFLDLFTALPRNVDDRKKRIFADHIRGIMFLVADGVYPGNKETGYILRRLLRRIIFFGKEGAKIEKMFDLVEEKYKTFYTDIDSKKAKEIFEEEYSRFNEVLEKGVEELKKIESVDAKNAFKLFESFGMPFELIKEIGGVKAKNLFRNDFEQEFKQHQEISRAGAEKKFGGHGMLLNTGELKAKDGEELKKVTRLHTATHLLQAALRKILGEEVKQMGSDITVERTRFDFSYSRKPTNEELKMVENLINDVISKNLPVNFKEMPLEKAKKTGALFFFKEKYPNRVKIYTIGPEQVEGQSFSKEFCEGPHVKNTSEIGHFKIQKLESIGFSTRRIRGIIK